MIKTGRAFPLEVPAIAIMLVRVVLQTSIVRQVAFIHAPLTVWDALSAVGHVLH